LPKDSYGFSHVPGSINKVNISILKHRNNVLSSKLFTNLTNLQCGHVWQEIIANKETNEYKIIYNAFKINLKWRIRNSEFILLILSKNPDIEKLHQEKSYEAKRAS
jgi:hypothetical protein